MKYRSRANSLAVRSSRRDPRQASKRAASRRRGPTCSSEPTQQRPDPRRDLVERERLDEVVVGPLVEAGDPVVDGVARGEHQDPRRGHLVGRRQGGIGADPPAQVEAVGVGQVEVQAHQVVRGDRQSLHRLGTVVGHVDGVALAPEPPGQRVGQVDLVLDHQQPHGANGSGATTSAPRGLVRRPGP
jgi:hypothetical protein